MSNFIGLSQNLPEEFINVINNSNIQTHKFDPSQDKLIDTTYWNIRVVILSCNVDDLKILPLLRKQRELIIVLALTTPNQKVWIGKSIDFVISIGKSNKRLPDNDGRELNLTSIDESGALIAQFLNGLVKQYHFRSDMFYLIGISWRANIPTFIHKLEHQVIGLESADEGNLDIISVSYGQNRYVVAGIATTYRKEVEQLAHSLNLKLTPGKPVDSMVPKEQEFPVHCATGQVFTITYLDNNCAPKGHHELQQHIEQELCELQNI